MRELILQRKTYKLQFTSLAYSRVIGNKNTFLENDIELLLPREVTILPGDSVEVIGTFKKGVLSKFDTHLSLTVQSIHTIKRRNTYGILSVYTWLRFLESVPVAVEKRTSGILEPAQSSLLAGIVFGGSNNLPKMLLQDTKTTGLIHITAASGYNVALLIGFSLTIFTRFFHRRISAILGLITVLAYSLMAGLSPPIVRASLMSILYLLAISRGMTYKARWSLGVSGGCMLIYQPFLLFSPSFLLSFTATAGVLYQDLLWKKDVSREGQTSLLGQIWGVLEENLQTTLSVLVFTAPILIYFFEVFSLVSVISNTVLLWMVGPLMYGGLLLSGVVFVSPLVSSLVAVPLSLALEVFIRCVHVFASFPLASIEIQKPHIKGVILWYVCLGGYILWRMAKEDSEC